jgi:branched-chain amino acid transport system permease protein
MTYWVDILDQALIFSIFAVSLNVLMGIGGQVSAAHAAFGAVGGYAAGYLSQKHGLPFGACLVIGMAFAAVVGFLVSLPALGLAGEYLILLTLTVQTIALVIISSVGALGGEFGLAEIKAANIFGTELIRPGDWVVWLLIIAGLVWLACWAMGASSFGQVLRGIRDDERATAALGKNTYAYKVSAFAITSGLAGLAGVLLVYYNGLAAPGLFGFDVSVSIIVMIVLGGSGNLLGALLGTAFVIGSVGFFEKAISLEPEKASLTRLMAYGIALVVILFLRPQGLLPEGSWSALRRRLRARGAAADDGAGSPQVDRPVAGTPAEPAPGGGEPAPASAAPGTGAVSDGGAAPAPAAGRPAAGAVAADQRPGGPLSVAQPPAAGDERGGDDSDVVLELRGLEKSFGGVQAVHDLTFSLPTGRTTALIGPNGAGKTTIFNMITGVFPPDEGHVYLRGEDITGLPLHRVTQRGLARTFQDVRIFGRLSALENVALAVPSRGRAGGLMREKAAKERARELVRFVGLERQADVPVSVMPYGDQKLVSLARVLATGADVVLLDEPASGIDARWLERTLDLIAELRAEGKTVCIVEHNLEVVERLADHVVFLEQGTVTAEGTMTELKSQERLVEAYFGMA